MDAALETVPFVFSLRWRNLRLLFASHNLDVALGADFYTSDMQPGGDHSLNCPSQVSLTEARRPAGHDVPPPLALRRRRVVFAECVIGLPWCCL